MSRLKPVFKNFIIIVLVIIALPALILIYTYFGTYLIDKVCIADKCYKIPKHWIIEVQVENYKFSYLGIKGFSMGNSGITSIKNTLRLRSFLAGASIDTFDFKIKENFLKTAGYEEIISENCKYWKKETEDKETQEIIFEENKIQLYLWKSDNATIDFFQKSFCNPIKNTKVLE